MDNKLPKIGTSMSLAEQLKMLEGPHFLELRFLDRVIHNRHQYIILLDKGTKNCHIIEVCMPNATNIAKNVIEKITNYSYLKIEIKLC